MRKSAGSALASLFASGLLIAMAAAAPGAEAAAGAGALDTSFGTGGKVLTNLGVGTNGEQIQAVVSDAALQSNGDIVVAGNFGLVRYLPDGQLDASFGTRGLAQTGSALLAWPSNPTASSWPSARAGTTSRWPG